MKLTNEQRLPQSIVRAAEADPYSRGEADISVTALIDAPRLHIMSQAFSGDRQPSIDVSTRLWALLGTAFHSLMDHDYEHNVTKEERLFMECNGWVVSGAIDRQVKRGRKYDIEDFKVTSVYTYMSAMKGEKDDWESQLNMYASLVEANGREVKDLYIIALMRDWRPREAQQKAGQYPPKPIMRIKINKRTRLRREKYMLARVQYHQEAQQLWDEEGKIVDCDERDRWYEGTKYAVMQGKNRRAVKLWDNEGDARRHASQSGRYFVEKREGANRRCEQYCDYSGVCPQWTRIQQDKIVDKVMEGLDV